ncbi:hypothetical protein [Methylorubrum extorquens]|uniref:hypothetical protein n=1 Tax=Methylorubrum extorquens TaxID=408 RepID=UPI00209C7D3F|nr:hypothetical protein [Methylorubrum extorquens]MCP1540111.1 hypothetical protein [Methylorubrum extorquens]
MAESMKELVALAHRHNLKPEDLDDSVHDAASSYASTINNAGLEGQIAFLVEQWGVEETRKFLADER